MRPLGTEPSVGDREGTNTEELLGLTFQELGQVTFLELTYNPL